MQELNLRQARQLLALQSSVDVEQWLKGVVGPDVLSNERYWRPVGGQTSNAGAIEASADEINPLIERVVNAPEAVIELKLADSIADDSNMVIPANPRTAIEVLWEIPRGEARWLKEDEGRANAHDVELVFRGERDTPTIVVRDRGIGIHPDDFANTIVSLGSSDKGQKLYLVGMYGQGGSSTFDKCEYTIIMSRRHPRHLPRGRPDLVGWTVIRRKLATRSHVYGYLVEPDTGFIPRFSGAIGDSVEIKHGTLVSHVDYRNLGPFAHQQITNRAYYTLNYRLFDPLIPWTMIEERNMSVTGSRTMRGVPYRIGELPSTSGIGLQSSDRSRSTASVRHNISFEYQDKDYGSLNVEWWVLQDEEVEAGRRRRDHADRIRPYRDPNRRYAQRGIAITRGGQTHAALTLRVFESKRLKQVTRSIVVHVNTDALTLEAAASFFSSNRAELKTESQDIVERAVLAAIESYADDLRAIERERQEELIRGKGASDQEAIRSRLDRIIRRAFASLRPGAGNDAAKSRGDQKDLRLRQIPTYLKFARARELGIRPGVPTHIDLLTDAADSTVIHRDTAFRVESDSAFVIIGTKDGGAGRWRVELLCAGDAPVGTKATVSAYMERVGIWRVDADEPIRVVVEPPLPPYEGNDPPTSMRFRSRNGEIHVRPGDARIAIETDCVDDLFRTGSDLLISLPPGLESRGHGHPRRGQIRAILAVPEDTVPGPVGDIHATLTLPSGASFNADALLVVEPPLEARGTVGPEPTPDYEIIDVRRTPGDETEESWEGMPGILDTQSPWGATDVAAYNLPEVNEREGSGRGKVVFYLNAENNDLLHAERRVAERRGENSFTAAREYHRTLLCFYLYQMAAAEIAADGRANSFARQDVEAASGVRRYEEYREEMVWLNRTLLYAQREFYELLLADEREDEE
jgi:hypothetical protein